MVLATAPSQQRQQRRRRRRRRRWFASPPWAALGASNSSSSSSSSEVDDPRSRPRSDTTTTTATAIAAGLAALSAAGAHRLSSLSTAAGGVSQAGEVASEAVCWALLAFVARVRRRRRGKRRGGMVRARADEDEDEEVVEGGMGLLGPESGGSDRGRGGFDRSVWAVAAGIVVACCYTAEIGEISLLPALTPLLLVADRKLRPHSRRGRRSGLAALANTVWGTSLVAAVALLSLVHWSLLELALPVLPAATLLLVYAAMIPRSVSGPRLLPFIPDIDEAIRPLSRKILILLASVSGIQCCAFGVQSIELGWTVPLLGLLKAGFWHFSMQTVWLSLLFAAL
ncbi:hypothetical protein VTH06DRAFT_1000 [Thermothelomyces fergusii]